MAEAILLGPVLRIILYVLVPLLIRFRYAGFGSLTGGKKLVIAFTWAAAATFLAIMISTGGYVSFGAELVGEILGGMTVGGLIGEIIMTVNSKKPETENSAKASTDAIDSDETITACEGSEQEVVPTSKEAKIESETEASNIIQEPESVSVVAEAVEDAESHITPTEIEQSVDAAMQTEETQELEKATIEESVTQEQTEKSSNLGETESTFVVPDEELRLLKRLYDSGVLTDSEFKEKKKMLLKI